MNIEKNLNFKEYLIFIVIFTIFILAIFFTYFNYYKNKKINLAQENHYEIISLIEKQKFLCQSEKLEWNWKEDKKEKCFDNLTSLEIINFFNNVILLRNPYDNKFSVYEIKKIPKNFIRGRSYLIVNEEQKIIKVFTLLDKHDKLLNNQQLY
jgi:uncharacterized protein YehS (DUF1456 family)|tara:strand:- start:327 stop:782 length:456 start_codon:yes stop_codon:yes gene_type:complete